MSIFGIFKSKIDSKKVDESNTLFGQTALGNNIVYTGSNTKQPTNTQILYVTTSSSTNAGRPVDMSMLTRNSTVMSCVAAKARALAQLPIKVMCQTDDGAYHDAVNRQMLEPEIKQKRVKLPIC